MLHARIVVVSTLLSVSLLAAPSPGGSPLEKLSLFKRLEADPNKTYPLVEDHGPWLILAATYSGEEAEAQAQALALELRREFKLPAYTHKMSWSFSDKIQGRGFDEYGNAKTMKYQTERREEIGVLVGDFPSLEDPTAKKTLDKIRHIRPQCLDPEFIANTWGKDKNARAFAGWRMAALQQSPDQEKKQRGPLGKAFLVTNPMLPDEYFKPKGLDPLVEKMNDNVEHSLIRCPGKYSVLVATFTGNSTSIPREVEQIERGERQLKSRLEKAAIDAHYLVEALRVKGYEAYEFHDFSASLVTVGSFQSVGQPRADGKIETDPEVLKIIDAFGAGVTESNGRTVPNPPKKLVGYTFDAQPVPIHVPKRTIASDYSSRVGLR